MAEAGLFFDTNTQGFFLVSVLSDHPCGANPQPCENGGTCNRRGEEYYCQCPLYWTGINCEIRKLFNCE